MKNLFVLLLTSIALAAPLVGAQQPVSLMTNNSPPYADDQLPEQGMAVEIVQHVFSRTDYQSSVSIENWSRAIEGAEIGVYDGLAAAWYSDERAETLLFSEPYLSSELILVKLRSDPRPYNTLAQISGKRLGVRADYAYGVDFSQVPGLRLVEENHLIQNLLNLVNGRVDLVIGDRRTVVMQLNTYLQDRLTRFEVVSSDLPSVARHVAASRSFEGHEDMIAAFNRALAEAKQDGSVDAIIKKWDEKYSEL